MLVLTRKLNESILIGDAGLEITILEIKGGRIRLGIKAPPEVPVRRKELADRDSAEPDVHGSTSSSSRRPEAPQACSDDSASQPDQELPPVKPRSGTDFEMEVCQFAGI